MVTLIDNVVLAMNVQLRYHVSIFTGRAGDGINAGLRGGDAEESSEFEYLERQMQPIILKSVFKHDVP